MERQDRSERLGQFRWRSARPDATPHSRRCRSQIGAAVRPTVGVETDRAGRGLQAQVAHATSQASTSYPAGGASVPHLTPTNHLIRPGAIPRALVRVGRATGAALVDRHRYHTARARPVVRRGRFLRRPLCFHAAVSRATGARSAAAKGHPSPARPRRACRHLSHSPRPRSVSPAPRAPSGRRAAALPESVRAAGSTSSRATASSLGNCPTQRSQPPENNYTRAG
jgi:hypothetical protein